MDRNGPCPRQRMAGLWKRLSTSAAQLWLSLAAFPGVGMLPCPEYGTPLILHSIIPPALSFSSLISSIRLSISAAAFGSQARRGFFSITEGSKELQAMPAALIV